MNPLNSILLEGNVVKTPDLRETPKGTSVCTFSIASNRSYRSESGSFDKEVSFFDVEAWGQLAIICSQQCVRGRGVRVVGRLKQGRWTDQAGKNHSKVTIIAEHVELKPVFQKEEKTVEEEEKSMDMQGRNAFIDSKATQNEIVEEREAALVF
ncbi:MAG: single-stranded DNA-binding protein [Treponemataceae bacterium]|nr:single-stranded DNA-binding protein [Treponemataceae bacterium]